MNTVFSQILKFYFVFNEKALIKSVSQSITNVNYIIFNIINFYCGFKNIFNVLLKLLQF